MPTSKRRWLARVAVVARSGAAGWWALRSHQPDDLPEGFARSNGRIEAIEIAVAAKVAGRIEAILAE